MGVNFTNKSFVKELQQHENQFELMEWLDSQYIADLDTLVSVFGAMRQISSLTMRDEFIYNAAKLYFDKKSNEMKDLEITRTCPLH